MLRTELAHQIAYLVCLEANKHTHRPHGRFPQNIEHTHIPEAKQLHTHTYSTTTHHKCNSTHLDHILQTLDALRFEVLIKKNTAPNTLKKAHCMPTILVLQPRTGRLSPGPRSRFSRPVIRHRSRSPRSESLPRNK